MGGCTKMLETFLSSRETFFCRNLKNYFFLVDTNNSDEFLNLLCLQQSKYCPLGSPMASRLENLCPSVVQGSRNSSSTVAAPSLSLFLYGIEAWRLYSLPIATHCPTHLKIIPKIQTHIPF